MFLKFIYCLLLLPAAAISQIPIGIGEWRTHVPYRNATSLADAGDRLYVSANVFFYSYDKETGSLQRFDKVSGLSDVGTTLVRYNPFDSSLVVIYENTNIDIIKNNTIVNISDIKRKQIVGEKKIHSVYFLGNVAYLSCSFGIVALDLNKLEIKDTYRIGANGANLNVSAFASDSNNFYAATDEGLKTARLNSPNLANYSEWSLEAGLPAKAAKHVLNFNSRIFANIMDTLFQHDGNNWSQFSYDPDWEIANLISNANHLIICERNAGNEYEGRIGIVTTDFVCCNYTSDPRIPAPLDAWMDDEGILWVADLLNNLIIISGGQIQPIYPPNGPWSVLVQNLSIARRQVWVAPGGVNSAFKYNTNDHGTSSFIQNWWDYKNQYTHPELAGILSFYDVAAHPSLDVVYFASWYSGLVEYNNGGFTVYDKDNSILDESLDPNRTIVSGLAFDRNENLWFTLFSAQHPIAVKKADGALMEFSAPGIEENWLSQIIIDDYDQLWMVTPKTNSHGILVYSHGENIDDTGDDQYKIYRSGLGNGNLPTNNVLCLAKDLDGEIWVGTVEGIAVFYCPSAVFDPQGCEAQQIIVSQNGVAGYLLETERVTTIAVDGANRKWVGTNNGVFLLSPDGTEQIAYYTVDNSPLLSNNITDIAIDGQTGEVFIGTEKGLVSLRGEATEGTTERAGVLVFPNPVRENYEGPIALKGLANNANVKITDLNGMLFYETTALGGQAVWNGRNYNGERAKTGVYLIFTSNDDGSSTHVTRLLIIN